MKEVIDELKNINSTLSGILEIMKRPEKSKMLQVFEIAGAGVGVLDYKHSRYY